MQGCGYGAFTLSCSQLSALLSSLQVEEQRGRYLDAYDIVLESDETLDVVNGILRYILMET